MLRPQVTLEDKFTLDKGPIFINGVQALVRLLLVQRLRDKAQGLNTAGFVSGYRGSPLGMLDLALWRASNHLKEHQIHFQPGINEELGATAVWGTQQLNIFKGSQVDGVFSIWYGKGPGVDRSGDVFKHGNAAGTSPHGGVLVLAGDDHACKSSSIPHQSDYALLDANIPVLVPATLQELLDYGLYGFALSRYAGVWTGFKLISDTVDTSASVYTDPDRVMIHLPQGFELPPEGVNIRWPDPPIQQEKRLYEWKLPAVSAFMRANSLDRPLWKDKKTRLGFVASGKAYLDLLQALSDLGIDESQAKKLGIAIYKPAMVWPLEREGLMNFAKGLSWIMVVEEKRPLLEHQIKEILYHVPSDLRPSVMGKHDLQGAPLLPSSFELDSHMIGEVLERQLSQLIGFKAKRKKVAEVSVKPSQLQRAPYYCSGCPHNTSTLQTPEGSRVMAGIGCHYMAMWISPETTQTFTQMGGEGVPWVGQAPFTSENHVFANLGDGTYYHSGILAIRQAIAAKVNITYKILYNDAVAMTGGQPVDGPLTVAQISQQVYAEGVRRIVVVSDDLSRYTLDDDFAPKTQLYHRDELLSVEEDLKLWPGVSVLIYDQTCAAEKRRRRKRGLMEDPPKRIFINETVCEGCGDCGKKSNCLSVIQLETEWGRKRTIDQSSCNKDYSCVKGFCPSFVSVLGGNMRKPKPVSTPDDLFKKLPKPDQPPLDKPYSIFVTGIGGTGVVTIGALVGMGAHLEGKGCSIVDMAGLAQKGGSVVSHLRIAQNPEDIKATRIAPQGADLILGCDMVVTSTQEGLEKIASGHTHLIMNSHRTFTGHFAKNPHYVFPDQDMQTILNEAAGKDFIEWVDATGLSTKLMGDSITSNLFQLGYAVQKGLIPVSPEAILEAIQLNDVAVTMNSQAFQWGRLAAVNLELVKEQAGSMHIKDPDHVISHSLEGTISRREQFLVSYQDQAYAERYRKVVDRVREVESNLKLKGLTEAVAQTYFRLMAYKDEYEVARLYTDGNFMRRLQDQFEGNYKLQFHLAPPLISRRDAHSGELIKQTYGAWVFKAFKVLAKLKKLRGTIFDIFGYTHERRLERQLIHDYQSTVETLLKNLTKKNHALACEIATLPQMIKGYGHVKEKNYREFIEKHKDLLGKYVNV